jgi:hypothetical protein
VDKYQEPGILNERSEFSLAESKEGCKEENVDEVK